MALEKNKVWFYPGLRRLQLVPWKYTIPDFNFLLSEKQRKNPVKRIEAIQIINNTVAPAKSKAKAAPQNQQSLFI